MQYRQAIGLFCNRMYSRNCNNFDAFTCYCIFLCLMLGARNGIPVILLLLCSGDVHPNPGPNNTDLKIIHINVCSLRDKVHLISAEYHNYDVICITETWLNSDILSNNLHIPGFHLPIRKDRPTRGGGVAIYVKQNIYYKHLQDLDITELEAIWVEIVIKKQKWLIGTLYRADLSNRYWDLIEESFSNACDKNIKTVILGDFNANIYNMRQPKIEHLMNMFNLDQVISEPTRLTSSTATLIDLIFVSCPNLVSKFGVLSSSCSDHCPVFATLKTNNKTKSPAYKRVIYDYSNMNTDGMIEAVYYANWNEIFDEQDFESLCTNFVEKLKNIFDEFVPHKEIVIRPNDRPWMNGLIRKLMRERNRKHKIAKRKNRPLDWQQFRTIRNRVISEIRKAKRNYDEKLDHKINNECNTKCWWRLVKQYFKKGNNKSSKFPPLEINGEIIDDETSIANALNDYFVEQASVNNPDKHVENLPLSDEVISSIHLNEKEICDILLSVDVSKAKGPDNISNRLLKVVAKPLSKQLARLFNLSVNLATFPAIWKLANVVPIFKKGNIHDCANYRPVALTSSLSKVLEKCIFKHVYNFFRDHNVISNLQSGFKPGDSTVYQLADLYNSISAALDERKEVRAVFCDISKAFDRVWHKGLIEKLKSCGIKGNLLDWFNSFLSGRSQRVVINGHKSDIKSVTAGVPQGSVLGPLMFLVYINDSLNGISSNMRLFADDTSLYIIIGNPDTVASLLNHDLATITNWANQWQVSFSSEKNQLLCYLQRN